MTPIESHIFGLLIISWWDLRGGLGGLVLLKQMCHYGWALWFNMYMLTENGDDVGFPSVSSEYILLPLVNKETALAYDRADYS